MTKRIPQKWQNSPQGMSIGESTHLPRDKALHIASILAADPEDSWSYRAVPITDSPPFWAVEAKEPNRIGTYYL